MITKEDAPFTRREFQIYLEERNIQTRVVFTGNILKQPMTRNINKKISEYGYENSNLIMKQGVLLPVHHGLTEGMFIRLHKTINDFLSKF